MSLPELEKAIAELSPQELSTFATWFEEYMADEWDKQIERDEAAGKFKKIIERVDAEIDAGRSAPL